MIGAVVLDFDGLILDTETPTLLAWQEEFERHGCTLSLDDWVGVVGTHDPAFDPLELLTREADTDVDRAAVSARQRARKQQLIAALEPMAGVVEFIAEVRRRDLPLGAASSSRRHWVGGHLERLGLRTHFTAVVGRDDVGGRAKPDPDVYVEVCRRLDRDPRATLAVEDSGPGVAAAKAAGLRVVAVPNRITRHTDLSAADLVLGSLATVTLDDVLEELS